MTGMRCAQCINEYAGAYRVTENQRTITAWAESVFGTEVDLPRWYAWRYPFDGKARSAVGDS